MRTYAGLFFVVLALALGACSGDDGNGPDGDSVVTPAASGASEAPDSPDADASPGAPQDAGASADDGEPIARTADKVTICHRTESDSNPFVAITIAESAIGGHLNHPEDVIPPTDSQPGQNWPSDIVDENCNPVEPTPEPTTPPTPEPTTPPTEPPVEPPVEPTPEPTEPPTRPPVEPTPSPSPMPPAGGGDGGPADGSDGTLANTGVNPGRLGVIAGLLLTIGAALTVASRRRELRAE